MRVSQWCGCLAGFACAAAGFVTAAQSQGVGSYTEAQAIAGRTAYNQSCAECHLGDLRGGFGPPLVGPNFTNVWGTREARVLFEQVKNTMPPGSEASLSDSTYIDIVAYILEVNGHAAGAEALRVDSPRAIDPGAAGASDDAPDEHGGPRVADRQLEVPSAGPVALVNREVTSFTPVTDELLRDPPDARRTGLQSVGSADTRERRSAASGVGLDDGARAGANDAARPRRRDVSRQSQ